MKRVVLSIIHSLSVMSIQQIRGAKAVISNEKTFSKEQKNGFIALCDLAIEEKRRHQSGKREI